MRTKFEFGAALAALALVATACFGGGGDEATLAQGDTQIADAGDVTIADLPPEPGTEPVPSDDTGDEDDGAEPETSPGQPESYEYADEAEIAASMVLVPADVADTHPGLIVDSLNTGAIDNLMAAARMDDGAVAAPLITTTGRLTGYESVLLTGPDAEVANGALLVPATDTGAVSSRVDLFADEAGAAAWLAENRAARGDDAADAAGLPGDAYVATYTTSVRGENVARTEAGFARGALAGSVSVAGHDAAAALEFARALAVRTYDVQQAAVPARDPYPEMGALHVPHRLLDSFRAQAEVVVADGDDVVWRSRESAVYVDANHYSCKATTSVGGTETLDWDLTVSGETAWYYADRAASDIVAKLDAGVADLVGSCAGNPDYWRDRNVHGFGGLPAGRGSTAVGPAAAYQTDDAAAVNAAFGWPVVEGEELVNYQEYVSDNGLSVAAYHESTMPRAVVEGIWGDMPGSSARLTVLTSRRILDANVPGLELTDFIAVETEFGLDVGEEVALVVPEPEPEAEADAEAPPADEGAGESTP